MIKIDEHEIRQELGEPTSVQGVFSNSSLSGIRLNLQDLPAGGQAIIEDLTFRDVVHVQDPFSGKEYQASVRQTSSSFTVGQDTKSYVLDISELDTWPNVEELEIEGNIFSVIQYEEFITDGEVGRKAVLRLNHDQFKSLRSLLSRSELSVRRVDVDDEPLKLRFGARMFWSEHEEDGEKYWKHIVRLYQIGKQSSYLDMASDVVQQNLSALVIQMSSRLNLLISILSESNAITEETKEVLLGKGWKSKVDESELNLAWDRLEQVRDAAEYEL